MINISLKGKEKVDKVIENIKNIDQIALLWMSSGSPDKIMQKSFSQNFSSQGRPKWKKLSEKTIAERKRTGFSSGPILVKTGNLKDEITTLKGSITKHSKICSEEWGINQLRRSEKAKFAGHQKGNSITPKREIIGFQEKDAKSLANSLRNWILDKLK